MTGLIANIIILYENIRSGKNFTAGRVCPENFQIALICRKNCIISDVV